MELRSPLKPERKHESSIMRIDISTYQFSVPMDLYLDRALYGVALSEIRFTNGFEGASPHG
jgi:hypothetical protein